VADNSLISGLIIRYYFASIIVMAREFVRILNNTEGAIHPETLRCIKVVWIVIIGSTLESEVCKTIELPPKG